MLTIANKGGEGVKKPEKHANVICERPLVQHRGCICTKLLQVHMHKKFELNRTKIKGDVSRVQKLQPTILSVINL